MNFTNSFERCFLYLSVKPGKKLITTQNLEKTEKMEIMQMECKIVTLIQLLTVS